MNGTIHYSTVNEVLDDMVGANYAITEEQIKGIRELCREAQVRQRNNLRKVLNLAYEAGRKHSREEYNGILKDINGGAYGIVELGDVKKMEGKENEQMQIVRRRDNLD